MFSVRLVRCIWTHAEKVVHDEVVMGGREGNSEPKVAILERSPSLPFAPFPGLEFSAKGWESGALQTVRWLSSEQVFRCTVKDEYPRNACGSELSYEWLLGESHREGWHRPEVGGGNAPR